MLDFQIYEANFSILFGVFVAFFIILYKVSRAIQLLIDKVK